MLRAPVIAVALCAFLLAGARQAHGQTAGVKAGILSSSLADDPDVGVSSRTGFGGGAWLQKEIRKRRTGAPPCGPNGDDTVSWPASSARLPAQRHLRRIHSTLSNRNRHE